MAEQKGVKWECCRVCGSVDCVNSGFVSSDSYLKQYRRRELKVGMNIAGHCSDLPVVKVIGISDDSLTVTSEGVTKTIYTGGFYRSPRKGLSYAYSDVTIKLE